MPTIEERNAAVAAVKKHLPALAAQLLPDTNIPFVGNIRQIGLAKLQDPKATPIILALVDDALEAAEKARA